MSLVTPSNVRFILNVSIASRILVILLQVLFNYLITDHDADAYRNRYHLSLTHSEHNTSSSIKSILPDTYSYSFGLIEGLTKWDGQYFLEISKDGYQSEQHLAFLPFYPTLISVVRQLVFDHRGINFEHLMPSSNLFAQQGSSEEVTVKDLEVYIQSALTGLVLNNFVLFPIACLSLFILTKLVKSSDDKYAKTVIWWFCFNPASIFFTACYSESTFSALTFTALFILELKASKYTDDVAVKGRTAGSGPRSSFEPLSQLNRLIYIILPSLGPIALSTAARSNGLVNIGFVVYQFLLKYVTLLTTNRRYWTIMAYVCLFLEVCQDILVLIMSSVFAASGYISFQIYSYIRFCVKGITGSDSRSRETIGVNHMMNGQKPDWCNKQFPHPYGQVQAKYWNVGFLKYCEFKQLPNFMLAAPITYIIFKGSQVESRLSPKPPRSKRQLAYYMQAIMLTLLCGVSINIQVVTRLIASSCPAFYWICVDLSSDKKQEKILKSYFVLYFLTGIIMHVNYFPWT